MTSVVAGVRSRLDALERKLREARGRCGRGAEIDRELGRLKSAAASVQSRCREQKAIAVSLVAQSRADRFGLAAKIGVAEERAKDLVDELEYVRNLLTEVQEALFAAEQAAKESASQL